ncbi:MAG: trehalose-6-phosphate synthase [Gammaproteobacteria bacterium]|nr:trehalose-6-phosphate synthase [Gammaproteobacteria bacterium]MCP5195479.1 trehalose-6-phosphate synthase [Gammaproteobacteria bacterium]
MSKKSSPRLPNALRMGLLVTGLVGLLIGTLAWFQVERERTTDLDEMDRRAYILAHQVAYSIQAILKLPDKEAAVALGSTLEGYRPLIGLAVYRPDSRLIAESPDLAEFSSELKQTVVQATKEPKDIIKTLDTPTAHIHIVTSVIRTADGQPEGVLAVVHDLTEVMERARNRRMQFAIWSGIILLLLLTVVVAGAWLLYDRPLNRMAKWVRQLRTGDSDESLPIDPPVARLATESDRLAASLLAKQAANRKPAQGTTSTDPLWTGDRWRAHLAASLRSSRLLLVSHREPYLHELQDGQPRLVTPPGGLVAALDPIMRASNGIWIAHGAGNADRQTADAKSRLMVPPGDPSYTLRRVWLSREEEHGYYHGFANEGLWPLCHLVYQRPVFRARNWEYYVRINRRFAEAVLQEAGSDPTVVLVHDYQLALVPRLVKEVRPDLVVGLFWYIPWPNPETFRICPWRNELLDGMLGADLIGFHLQQYCNNFVETVDRLTEARLDWQNSSIEWRDHISQVHPFPIGVENKSKRRAPSEVELAQQITELREQHALENMRIALGVDRIDYIKGLPERFNAVARFLERYPQYRGQFTLVQLGVPSRMHIRRYRDHLNELESLADTINWRFQTLSWKPIRFLVGQHDPATVHAFMRMAEMGIVSSLHDGMNLVAKEFVAARSDLDGVLVLSEFTGAARELTDALIINPYDTEQFAEALQQALDMPANERQERMSRMRQQVEVHNVYRWAADFLTALTAGPAIETRD